ncbi:MAG: hypothetical protein R3C05_00135 [Pirellulaceae bacterium]
MKSKRFLEIVNVPQLEQRWNNSFVGAISNEPALKEFFDSQREAIRGELSEAGLAVNFTVADIRDMASGEAALIWLQLETKNAVCVMVDT